jgi:hypothetical protein
MSTKRFIVAGMFAAVIGTVACKAEVEDVPASECASGKRWVGGESESPRMHPGTDCIACHDRGEGPGFAVAGTVYPIEGIADPDDCFGIPGASVLVEDAAGRAFALETNDAGNFYLARSEAPAFPLRIELEYDGLMQAMTMRPAVGACASCHTEEGLGGAIGRIIAPRPQ